MGLARITAHLCGVAPIDASAGLAARQRLSRGGDRSANQACWRVVMVVEPSTRASIARRTANGRARREIIRALERYLARNRYRRLPRVRQTA